MAPQKGILKAWKDDKGFGFIKPEQGGSDVFVHIRDFGAIPRKPRVGDLIHYQPMQDKTGRPRAGDVHIEGLARASAGKTAKRRPRPQPGRSPQPGRKSGPRILSSALTLLVIGVLGFAGYDHLQNRTDSGLSVPAQANPGDAAIQRAFDNRQSNIQVSGSGVVERILPDDLEGSRHQKFILRLATGQTLLVAHNIDLAPRIDSLSVGDRVAFNGEYEWNARGGVLHWTHHDPARRHEAGWLEHEGRRYQ